MVNENTNQKLRRTGQSYARRVKITGWLFEHRRHIGHRSIDEMAEWASRDLKFQITGHNIKSILQNLGIPTNLVKFNDESLAIELAVDKAREEFWRMAARDNHIL